MPQLILLIHNSMILTIVQFTRIYNSNQIVLFNKSKTNYRVVNYFTIIVTQTKSTKRILQ